MSSGAIFPNELPPAAQEVRKRLEACKRPLLLSHIRIDGDALGSELGLAFMLRDRGAEPHVVNDSAIPKVYRFMPGVDDVGTSPDALRDDYDLAVALDMASWGRAAKIRKKLSSDVPVIRIDHHQNIEQVGEVEWVEGDMSSVGEMLYRLGSEAGWRISPEAATCLYVAIVTDTGRFTFPNTKASSFHVAGQLMDLGADHLAVSEHLYQQEDPAVMALRAEAVVGMKRFAEGRVAVMRITQEMLDRLRVDPIDTQNLAELPRSQSGVVVGVTLMEMPDDGQMTKVSFRAAKGCNIEPVARRFGGGGHQAAAGCRIAADMDTAEKRVLEQLLPVVEQLPCFSHRKAAKDAKEGS